MRKALLICLLVLPLASQAKHTCGQDNMASLCDTCALGCLGVHVCINKCMHAFCSNFIKC